MGRPSKLTQRQHNEIAWRLLTGERAIDLAREFGVSKASISERFGSQVRRVHAVAQQLLQADEALRALTPLQQLAALQMAEELHAKEAVGHLLLAERMRCFRVG